MSEDSPDAAGPTEDLAPYLIEGARSSRSKCKTCRKAIEKGTLRIGFKVEGPFGTGYMWHHLKCAARRSIERVAEAYEQEAWAPGTEVPALDSLRTLAEEAAQKKAEKKSCPYAEQAPTGRSKCKHCEQPIEKGAWRVAILREVTFGNQTRAGAINVHPGCVAEALRAPDCASEAEGFAEALRANSGDVDSATLDAVLAEIGPLEG